MFTHDDSEVKAMTKKAITCVLLVLILILSLQLDLLREGKWRVALPGSKAANLALLAPLTASAGLRDV
jgi:hypothetical protein